MTRKEKEMFIEGIDDYLENTLDSYLTDAIDIVSFETGLELEQKSQVREIVKDKVMTHVKKVLRLVVREGSRWK